MASTIFDLAKNVRPYVQDYYNPHGYKLEINNTLTAFISLLDSQLRNKSTFTYSAVVLENILWLWHNDLVMKQARNLMKELETQNYKVNQYQKQEYDKIRKWHCDLMDEHVRFAKRVNADFNEPVLRVTSYEPPPDLWQA